MVLTTLSLPLKLAFTCSKTSIIALLQNISVLLGHNEEMGAVCFCTVKHKALHTDIKGAYTKLLYKQVHCAAS